MRRYLQHSQVSLPSSLDTIGVIDRALDPSGCRRRAKIPNSCSMTWHNQGKQMCDKQAKNSRKRDCLFNFHKLLQQVWRTWSYLLGRLDTWLFGKKPASRSVGGTAGRRRVKKTVTGVKLRRQQLNGVARLRVSQSVCELCFFFGPPLPAGPYAWERNPKSLNERSEAHLHNDDDRCRTLGISVEDICYDDDDDDVPQDDGWVMLPVSCSVGSRRSFSSCRYRVCVVHFGWCISGWNLVTLVAAKRDFYSPNISVNGCFTVDCLGGTCVCLNVWFGTREYID